MQTPKWNTPKVTDKYPEKVPNVATETLAKNSFCVAFGAAFLSL